MMKFPILPATAAALALSACSQAYDAAGTSEAGFVDAPVISADGSQIGTVRLSEGADGVRVMTSIGGIPAGSHGFHIHETGVCDPATKFSSAGGHYMGSHDKHGSVPGGPHAGDMPNQTVGSDGVLAVTVINDKVTMMPGGMNTLADADGSALVVHAGADDFKSQPSGDAGGRLACAVIFAPAPT